MVLVGTVCGSYGTVTLLVGWVARKDYLHMRRVSFSHSGKAKGENHDGINQRRKVHLRSDC